MEGHAMRKCIKKHKNINCILDDAIMQMLLVAFNYKELDDWSKIKPYINDIRKIIWKLEIDLDCDKLLKNE